MDFVVIAVVAFLASGLTLCVHPHAETPCGPHRRRAAVQRRTAGPVPMRGLKLLTLLAGLVLAGCERGSVSEAAADVRAAAASQSARSATAELNLRRLQVAGERYAELLAREPIVWEKMAIAARQEADALAGLSPHVTATPTRAAMETAVNYMNDAARSKDLALARRASAAERTLNKPIAAMLAKSDSAPR